MINHARTLLLNVAGDFISNRPGEELIDPSYAPLTLPNYLQSVRRVLFGADPDAEMLNYRGRQLLSLVHSCELVDLVTALDPRITYGFEDSPYYDQRMFLPSVSSELTGSNNSVTGFVAGHSGNPDVSGRMRAVWLVELLTGSTASVQLPNGLASTANYTVSGGLTSPIPLAGSDLSLTARDSSFSNGSGPRFRIEVLRKPAVSCGSLLATTDMLSTEVLFNLFQGSAEPWPTLRNYWQKHFALAQRLGSLALALIYKTEAIRNT